METYQEYFVKEYTGEFMKMNQIEQNSNGSTIGIAYQDNGDFFVSILDVSN